MLLFLISVIFPFYVHLSLNDHSVFRHNSNSRIRPIVGLFSLRNHTFECRILISALTALTSALLGRLKNRSVILSFRTYFVNGLILVNFELLKIGDKHLVLNLHHLEYLFLVLDNGKRLDVYRVRVISFRKKFGNVFIHQLVLVRLIILLLLGLTSLRIRLLLKYVEVLEHKVVYDLHHLPRAWSLIYIECKTIGKQLLD